MIENKAEGHETVPLEISACGKVVARKLFTFGWSPGDRMYRESITWDTRGVPPGEYRIRAEVFVWGDSSPFDNFLDAELPVTLCAPGTPFPDGIPPGGSATEADPRFMNRPIRGGGGSQAETAPSGGGTERDGSGGKKRAGVLRHPKGRRIPRGRPVYRQEGDLW